MSGLDQPVRVSFVVRNTGSRAGTDVPQVYLRDDVASVTTPVRKLVGFEKVTLQPAESRRVSIEIPAVALSLWNAEMRRVVEPGRFSVMVAASAEDVRLHGSFEVQANRNNHEKLKKTSQIR